MNADDIWRHLNATPKLGVDTEVIAAIIARHVEDTGGVVSAQTPVFELVRALCPAFVWCRRLAS